MSGFLIVEYTAADPRLAKYTPLDITPPISRDPNANSNKTGSTRVFALLQ